MLYIKYNLGEHTLLVHMWTSVHVVTVYLYLYRVYCGEQQVILDMLVVFRSVLLYIYTLRNGTRLINAKHIHFYFKTTK